MDKSILTIAVASDLHAHALDDETPSYLDVRNPATLINQNPLAGLHKLINDEHLKADVLLSPGDLGHQASAIGIGYAWNGLQEVGKALSAHLVTATAGNHDIDSRYKGDDHAPEHILKGLEPSYPLLDEAACDRYWGRAYTIADTDRYRLLILNSSAFHGNTPIEKNYGRIDKQTLSDIEVDLRKRGKKAINILLCHHHPQQQSEFDLGSEDYMRQGQLLIDMLGSDRHGQWLIVHGHKHHPKISYASGGANSPVIFSAGSLASKLFIPAQSVSRNQFYIININPLDVDQFGLVGTVCAWDWAQGTGWVPAGEDSGLPAMFGFGIRPNITSLAKEIATFVKTKPVKWDALVTKFPVISFLLPQDLKSVEAELHTHGIQIMRSRSAPIQIGRSI